MKQLQVPLIDAVHIADGISRISMRLDEQERHVIAHAPWPAYPYTPGVQFSMAHTNDNILIKYYVKEKAIRAAAGQANGAVWEDSCVEFFISFDDTGYYNLEFNCIGTACIGFGRSKTNRNWLPQPLIDLINYQVAIQKTENSGIYWQLTLVVPVAVFQYHQFTSIGGRQCRMNFYKCGDGLPEPHFLAWSAIEWPEPNFHLPQFFGTVCFE